MHLGNILGHVGAVLGRSWPILAPILAHLAPLLAHPKPLLAHLGSEIPQKTQNNNKAQVVDTFLEVFGA